MLTARSIGLLVVLISMLFTTACGITKGKGVAETAVIDFHRKLDTRDFASIYGAAHPDFRNASTEDDFTALLDAVRRKLGPVLTPEQSNWNVSAVNAKTNVTLVYKTKFLEGDAVETFTYRIEGDDALLLGYNINSQALILK